MGPRKGNARRLDKKCSFAVSESVKKGIGDPISHGTLVELCVPRKKCSRSSLKYKSIANIVQTLFPAHFGCSPS